MGLPTNADVIVVHGYWLDELTGAGVKQANGLPATIMFDPVPLLGANAAKTPNLRDLTSNAHLKTRTRVASVDPVTGYYAAQLVASNDPDLDAYSGRRVTFLGEDPFTIEVPYNAPTVTVSAEMAAKTGLTQGSSVKAIWLPNASVTTIPTPTPSVNYLSSSQTLANIAAGIETHDEDPAAHADIRALIGTPYTDEQARDTLAAALVPGSNVTITPNDGADTITISVTVPASYSDEQAQDAFAALIAAGTHSGISFAYNDAGNALSATVAAQSWSQITGKPTFAAVATSGSASDITTGTLPDGVIPSGIARDTEVATAVASLVNSAPTTLDTLGEIATALQADESTAAALATTVASKAPLNRPIRSVTANTTAVAGELLKVDASGGARTVTPPASPATGIEVIVMKTDASANAVVWSGTVDGDAQGAQLVAQWAAASYVYDGAQWLVRATNLGATAVQLLTAVTATKTANYTAAGGELVPVDTTGGAVTVTSPSGGPFAVRWKAGTTGPTVTAANGFTINGAASAALSLPPSTSSGELVVFQCFGADYQQVAGFKPQSALNAANDARYPLRSELLVNVKDYGAVGDGVTDDTTALQAAINSLDAAKGGIVWLPPGKRYNFTTLNITTKRVVIEGSGVLLNGTVNVGVQSGYAPVELYAKISCDFDRDSRSTTVSAISIANARHVDVTDLTVNNYSALVTFPALALGGTNTQHSARILVSNIRTPYPGNNGPIDYLVYGSANTSGGTFAVGDLTVSNCPGVSVDIAHIYAAQLDGLVCTGNTFFFPGYTRANANKLSNIILTTPCDFVTITGNQFFEAGYEAINLTDPRNITITGNNIAWPGQRDLKDGIALTVSSGGYARGVISSNNITLATKAAVAVYGQGDAASLVIGPNSTLATNPVTSYYGATTLPASFNRYTAASTLATLPRVADMYNSFGLATSDQIGTTSADTVQRLGLRSSLMARSKVLSVTAANTVLATLSNASGSSATYGGLITVAATDSGGTHLANYVLAIGGSSTAQTVTTVSSAGETTGPAATSPSFTFSINSSAQLLVSPVGSASGSFSFYATVLGNLRYA